MAYNKSPPSRGEWGRAAQMSILSLKSMGGIRDFGSQIYKEIITAQTFKQKIWHMTTSSEILLKIVRGEETKKRVAFRGRGADVRRLGHNSFFGGCLRFAEILDDEAHLACRIPF